ALPFVGHAQIRARGTLGGSLAHGDPAAELPAVMVALGARLTLRSARGRRTVAAENFFLSSLATALAPDELLTEIALPPWPARTGSSLQEVAIRRGDFALGGVAATLTLDAQGRVGTRASSASASGRVRCARPPPSARSWAAHHRRRSSPRPDGSPALRSSRPTTSTPAAP